MSSTKPTAPSITQSAGLTSPVSCSRSGTTFAVQPVLNAGKRRVSSACTRVMSSCACAIDTPSLTRPTTQIQRPRGVRAAGAKPTVDQTSTDLSRIENPGAITPTTRLGVPFSMMVRFTIDGSAPKRWRQSRSLIVTTATPGASSCGVKSRPSAGLTPSVRKIVPDTYWTGSSVASPAPVSVVRNVIETAESSLNDWFSSRQ